MDSHTASIHHGHAHAHHNVHHSGHHASSSSHYDDDMYHRMHAVAAFEQASAGSIYVLTTKGQDNQCGWYGCKGDFVKCNFNPHFLPDELNGIITFAEFAAMTKEVSKWIFLAVHAAAHTCNSCLPYRLTKFLRIHTCRWCPYFSVIFAFHSLPFVLWCTTTVSDSNELNKCCRPTLTLSPNVATTGKFTWLGITCYLCIVFWQASAHFQGTSTCQ